VSKTVSTTEATIIKEPVVETKTVEMPVTHEELVIERRPAVTDADTIDKRGERREWQEKRKE
jgi:uncharacterized protein (TIGR02271 family)